MKGKLFQELLLQQGHLAKAQAELAKAQALKAEEETKEKVDEAIHVNAPDAKIKEYNDAIVTARRSILKSSQMLGSFTGGDKARSKKLGKLQMLMDELLELLNDKEITSLVNLKNMQ